MANGYQPGEYFERFLSQLPQMYQAQQNMRLQEERLQYTREQGLRDDEYRSQVLSANQESNRLAEFKLQAESLVPGTKAYNTWLLSQPWVKKDPTVENQIRETFEIQDDLMDRIRSTVAMEPLEALPELRNLSQNRNQTKAHFDLIQTLIKNNEEAVEVTQTELAAQPSYKNLENERILLQETRESGPRRRSDGGLESLDDYKQRVNDISLNIEAYEKDVILRDISLTLCL